MNAQMPATRTVAAPLPTLAHRARLVFISAERSDYPHAVNAARSHYLLCELARLQRLHHVQMIWPCQGMYAGQREQAYCILANDLLDLPLLVELAVQFEQESILVAEPGPDGLTGKLVFTDGSGAPDAPLGALSALPLADAEVLAANGVLGAYSVLAGTNVALVFGLDSGGAGQGDDVADGGEAAAAA